MPQRRRVTGLPHGGVDFENREIQFDLLLGDGKSLPLVVKYGVAAQVISGLGRMLTELRRALYEAGAVESTSAETVVESHVQKERWRNVVLLQLVTNEGVPYSFALPPDTASGIADQLKSESAKSSQVGNA